MERNTPKTVSSRNISQRKKSSNSVSSKTKKGKRRGNDRNKHIGFPSNKGSSSGISIGGCDKSCNTSNREMLTNSEQDNRNDKKCWHTELLQQSSYENSKRRTCDHKSRSCKCIGYHRRGKKIIDEQGIHKQCLSHEIELYEKLTKIHEKIHKSKWEWRKWGKKPPGVRKEEDHYSLWRNAYDSYLWEIFDRVIGRVNKFKKIQEAIISFENFADFAYNFSSGYIISPYY